MAITFDPKILNSVARNPILKEIEAKAAVFSKKHQLEVHLSDLPFIRTATSALVSNEFVLFLGLSILVSALIFCYSLKVSMQYFSNFSSHNGCGLEYRNVGIVRLRDHDIDRINPTHYRYYWNTE
jgi:hypothetical protein